jgi:hypothetical protein
MVVFNPLRDRAPEQAAETLLLEIRRGNMTSPSSVAQISMDISAREKRYPLRAWKLVNRKDRSSEVTLFYRTARDSSSQFDSPVIVQVELRNGRWLVTGFNPVY